MSVKYISVDVESSGGIHGKHSLLEIGACDCDNYENKFQIYVKPISDEWTDSARSVNKPHEFYMKEGILPYYAMSKFAEWLSQFHRPVFIGFPVVFDYGWINYYFHNFLGKSPFGINGLDIKSFYMGKFGCEYPETTKKKMKIKSTFKHTHNALDDAIEQADIFNQIRRIPID